MLIAIMSDSHDRWDNLEKAIRLANGRNCELLLFAGDFISPPGLPILEKFDGVVKFVWGNNEGERVELTRQMDASNTIDLCGDIYEDTVDDITIFMNHYPRASEIAVQSGKYDLCIFGHTHEYHQEQIGHTLLVNPGEIQGYKTGQSTFIIFDTNTRTIEKVTVR